MAKNVIYSSKYYLERDDLDPTIAASIYLLCKKNNIKSVLDVGCGTGRLVNFLNQKKIKTLGIDSQAEAVKIAQKNNLKNKIFKSSAAKMQFKSNSFDLITAISVIEHLTSEENTHFLKKSFEILNKNGFIFLITPNFASPFRYLFGDKWFGYKDSTHLTFYTPKSISTNLKKAGFRNINFRFETSKNIPFNWPLPKIILQIPKPAANFLNYLLISSPLSIYRDSIWVSAQK